MVRLSDACGLRERILLILLLDEFAPDETATETWLVERRWPDRIRCAHCDSIKFAEPMTRRPQRHWCHDCRRYFSVKTHSVMHRSPLSCRIRVAAVYLMLTSLRRVASTKLAQDMVSVKNPLGTQDRASARPLPMIKTVSCSDRSRSMRLLLMIRRRTNTPPSATGIGV